MSKMTKKESSDLVDTFLDAQSETEKEVTEGAVRFIHDKLSLCQELGQRVFNKQLNPSEVMELYDLLLKEEHTQAVINASKKAVTRSHLLDKLNNPKIN